MSRSIQPPDLTINLIHATGFGLLSEQIAALRFEKTDRH